MGNVKFKKRKGIKFTCACQVFYQKQPKGQAFVTQGQAFAPILHYSSN